MEKKQKQKQKQKNKTKNQKTLYLSFFRSCYGKEI